MTLIFWASIAGVAYVYAGYPAMLRLWARLSPHPLRAAPGADPLPGVSIVIAARNEAARLASRIDNLLALDYPADKQQIIVVSDGSTDDTLEVLARYRGRVEAIQLPPGGKALALNAGVARARFELVIFADARQAFAPDALRQLVGPFADPQVGGVTGELVLDCESTVFSNLREAERRRAGGARAGDVAFERRQRPDRRTVASTIADGVGLYWRYEKALRRLESTVGSTLGATGAIYALRRSVWRPLPADTILDDVLAPMRAVMAGYRVVFTDQARAFDRAAQDAEIESRRKVRTLAGNYQILGLEPGLLLPWRNPVWLQYVSHKIGRLLVPYALLAAFFTNIVLATAGRFYQVLLAGQVGFVLLAGYGALLDRAARTQRAGRSPRQAGQVQPGPAVREVA